jgi:hypothetical protein
VICRRQGNHDEAASLYRRGLALLDNRVTPDHPAIASLQANLRKLDADHEPRA